MLFIMLNFDEIVKMCLYIFFIEYNGREYEKDSVE